MKQLKKSDILRSYIRMFQAISLLLPLFTLVLTKPVKADIGPPMTAPIGTLGLYKYQDTKARMLYERVEMELQFLDYD